MKNLYNLKWLDIRREIDYAIIRGDYKDNYRILSINELVMKYNCSKGTAIKILDSLVDDGIAVKRNRSGYFLVSGKITELQKKYRAENNEELFKVIARFREMDIEKDKVKNIFLKMLDGIYNT